MKYRVIILSLLCSLPCFNLPAQEPAKLTAEQAWQRLKDGNAKFAADKSEKKDLGADKRKELAKGQKPFAVVLTCADSRVPPELVFNQGLGDIFVLRVAGNISEPYVLASIEYAVGHLSVPLVVVLGHDSCGAVQAAFDKGKPGGNLGKLIGEIHVGNDLPKDKEMALAIGIKNNALYHGKLLAKRSEVIQHALDQKKLRIVTGVYHLASGKVEWLDEK
jgi:carbonic anhydrase